MLPAVLRFLTTVPTAGMMLLLAASPGHAFVNCLARPLDPNCCPSPCPVEDLQKITQYVGDGQQLMLAVGNIGVLTQRWQTIGNTVGSGVLAGPMFPSSVNTPPDFSFFLPAWLSAGSSASPTTIPLQVQQALQAGSGLSGAAVQAGRYNGLISSTAADALADGLSMPVRQTANGGPVLDQKSGVAGATTVRADWQQNSAARRTMLADIQSLHESLTTWTAAVAAQHSQGGAPVATATTIPPSVPPPAIESATPETLVSRAEMSTFEAAQLHNQRYAAGVLRAQFAGLQNTVASDALVIELENREAKVATNLLNQLFVDGTAAFRIAQSQLLALDPSDWSAGAGKTSSAAFAAAAVTAAIMTNPAAYGVVRAADFTSSREQENALRTCFASWLEDQKLARYWRPLRQGAEETLAALDKRLRTMAPQLEAAGALPSAAQRESSLIDQARHTLDIGLARVREQSLEPVRTILTERGLRIRREVVELQSDPLAGRLILSGHPS